MPDSGLSSPPSCSPPISWPFHAGHGAPRARPPALHPELPGSSQRPSLLSQQPCEPQVPSATGRRSAPPTAMRSRLLLPVAHLPTIQETLEETPPGGPGQEPPASPSLDDYVKSICQLAQPTSVLDVATARAPCCRTPRAARGFRKSPPTESLQDITTHFSGQQPAPPRDGTADPLDWLFGESQEKRPSRRDPPRRTGSSADSWGPHRQMDSGKARGTPRGRLWDARVQGHSLGRPSRDWHQSSWASRQLCGAAASPSAPRPSSTLKTLYLHLPVIHEL